MKKKNIKIKNKMYMLMLVCAVLMVSNVAISTSVKAVSISKSKVTIRVGATKKLKLNGTSSTVKWSSSKKSVATVSQKGKIKTKKKGNAIITAKVGAKKYKCKVTVIGKYDYNKYLTASKIRETLGVPKKATCKIKFSEPYFWSGGACYLTYVQVNGIGAYSKYFAFGEFMTDSKEPSAKGIYSWSVQP